MFSADSTTAVRGVDKLIPVDLICRAVRLAQKRSLMLIKLQEGGG